MFPRTLRKAIRRTALSLGRTALAATIAGISLLHPATTPFAATPPVAEASTTTTLTDWYGPLVNQLGPAYYNRMGQTTAAGLDYGASASFAPGVNHITTAVDVQPAAMPSTTWEAWVKPAQFAGIFMSDDDGFWDRTIGISGDGHLFAFTGAREAPGPLMTLNVWQHVAVVYTPTSIKLYLNGVETVLPDTPVGGGTVNRLVLGSFPDGNIGMRGLLDEVAVFNSALTPVQIAAHYQAGKGLLPLPNGYAAFVMADNPVAYWPMDNRFPDHASNLTGHWGDGAYVGPRTTGEQATPPNFGLALASEAGTDGSGFPFPGTGGYSTPVRLNHAVGASMEAWVYPTRPNAPDRQAIICQDDGAWDICLNIEFGSDRFMVFDGSVDVWLPATVDYNTWQHIAVVYTPTNTFFYKNGVQFARNRAPFTVFNGATNNTIHVGMNPTFGEFFEGRIDEVALYNRALGPQAFPASRTSITPAFSAGSTSSTTFLTAQPVTTQGVPLNNRYGASCTRVVVTTDGLNQQIPLSCTDRNGTVATAIGTASVDRTGPAISYTIRPPDYMRVVNGQTENWYKDPSTPYSIVTVTGTDALAGGANCGVSNEQRTYPWGTVAGAHVVQYTAQCTDRLGNVSQTTLPPLLIDWSPVTQLVWDTVPGEWYGPNKLPAFHGVDGYFSSLTQTPYGSGARDCQILPNTQLLRGTWGLLGVQFRCNDNVGNTGTYMSYVPDAVVDLSPPGFNSFRVTSPPNNGNIILPVGQLSTVVTYSVDVSDNGSGVASSQCFPESGAVFMVGITLVECTAVDKAGNPTPPNVYRFPVQISSSAPMVNPNAQVASLTNATVAAGGTAALSAGGKDDPKRLSLQQQVSDLQAKVTSLTQQQTARAAEVQAAQSEAAATQTARTQAQQARDAALANVAALQAQDPVDLDAVAREQATAAYQTSLIDQADAALATLTTRLVDLQQALTDTTAALTAAQAELATATAALNALIAEQQSKASLALTYSGGTTNAKVTAATYTANPTSQTFFAAGGNFTDINIQGASPSSRVDAKFYYPATITGTAEQKWRLMFFYNGTWMLAKSTGGVDPVKDTTDNLDGSISGGRFSLQLSDTSVPRVTDLYGTVFGLGEDSNPPVISGMPANITVPATGASGATVTWTAPTAADDVDETVPVTCTPASGSTFAAAATTTVTCTATDGAGNSASASFTVTVGAFVADTTPPTITAAASPAPNAAGWNKTDVTVTFTCADSGSGIQSCTAPATVSTEGAANVVSGTATDNAGNTASTSLTVKLDKTAPTVTAPANQTATTNGSSATVTYPAATATDALSGVAGSVACAPASGSTFAVGDTTVTCSATDNAGNTGNATFKVSVVADTTPPTITAAASPAANAAGWNKTDVTVTFTCADSGSGIQSCTAPATVSTEGAANVVSGTAKDNAGNTASASLVVKLDKTAPTVSVPANQTATTAGTSATVTYPAATATDALSGVAGAVTCAPASGSSFPLGTTTVACSATDVAGNVGTASFTVTVTQTTPPTGPQLKDFVAFSTDQTWLKKGVTVVSGNVGANTAQAEATRRSKPKDDDDDDRQAQDRKVEVRIGENSTLPAGGKVIGDTVWLRKGSKVGAVQSNELVKAKGVTTGTLTDGVTLPLLTLPALPTFTPGTQDVTVKKGQTRTLAAGAYDVVTVEKGATLTLSGGLYQITTLAVDQDAKVLVSAATELRVKNEVDLDKGASFVPASGSGITAKDIKVLVLGGDDRGRKHDEDDDVDDGEAAPTAVSIGKDAKLQASIYAPNGTVWLQKGVTATGAFVGKRLQVGENAKLTLDSGF